MARPAGLILDYGNVLSRPQDERWFAPAARRVGASPAGLQAAYWRHRHDYDGGLPVADYWRRVLAESRPGHDGPLSGGDLAWLIRSDVESWVRYDEEVWRMAEEFHASGGRTACLSNSGPEVMARVRADHPLEACFDAVIISCEVGLSKPDPPIYRLCLERIALRASETIFVDDRADNIEGAAGVGLRTHLFDGPDALDRLRALLR
ncbi:MAG TPA: HAD family phosphatase [Methylomirabilota bacterium]|nr:HAD family phosphatase [Methylomirabilota bacterium]